MRRLTANEGKLSEPPGLMATSSLPSRLKSPAAIVTAMSLLKQTWVNVGPAAITGPGRATISATEAKAKPDRILFERTQQTPSNRIDMSHLRTAHSMALV